MTLKEALAQAKKTGGNVDWSKEKGWFVEPQYKGKAVSEVKPFAWPHQTETGAGFLPFWLQ